MAILAGMDLGFGSQVKILRTNYLYAQGKAGDAATTAQQATYLQLFNQALAANQTGNGQHPLHCDYIIPSIVATDAATNPDARVTVAAATTLPVPVMGPTNNALGKQSGLGDNFNTAAEMGSSANGYILGILGVSLITPVIDSNGVIQSAGGEDLLTTTAGPSGINTQLLAATVDASVDGGVTSGNGLAAFFLLGDIFTDLAASDHATAAIELDTITTSPVFAGNAAGTTATTLTAATGFNTTDGNIIVSVLSLARS
jgi:hypothetical protein